MNVAVVAADDFKDWEKFQSIVDAFIELYPTNFIVTAKPHKLLSLYCKIDIVDCYINSFREVDKYNIGLVFATNKTNMSKECEQMCYANKPYYIYNADIDEFRYVHLQKQIA